MKFESFKQLLSHCAEKYGENVALRYDNNGTVCNITYAELYADVCRRAQEAKNLKENCVGILQVPSAKWIIDMFACVIAGKQTVLLDATSDAVTLQKCVLATDVETLFTDDITAPYKNALKTCPQTVKKRTAKEIFSSSRRARRTRPKRWFSPQNLCVQALGTVKRNALAIKTTTFFACFRSPTCSALCAQCFGPSRKARACP